MAEEYWCLQLIKTILHTNEERDWILSQKRSWRREMATRSSIAAWNPTRQRNHNRLQSMRVPKGKTLRLGSRAAACILHTTWSLSIHPLMHTWDCISHFKGWEAWLMVTLWGWEWREDGGEQAKGIRGPWEHRGVGQVSLKWGEEDPRKILNRTGTWFVPRSLWVRC